MESGSQKVLESINKGTTPEQAIKAFKWCKEIGIITIAHSSLGNPQENDQDIDKSIKLMKKLDPDYAHFSICSAYPGTSLYQMAMDSGIVDRDVWHDFTCNPLAEFESPVWTQYFTKQQLIVMAKRAFRSVYLRPSFIFKQLQSIHSFSQLKALIRSGMAMLFD